VRILNSILLAASALLSLAGAMNADRTLSAIALGTTHLLQATVANPNYQHTNYRVPGISIKMESAEIRRGRTGLVKLRIDNASEDGLSLWEPSSFELAKDEDRRSGRIDEGYLAFVPLWKYSSTLSKPNDKGILRPGDSFECEIDLTKLKWKISKLSVDERKDLFEVVPAGPYQLFFSLESPQEVVGGRPMVHIYDSNELSVRLVK
jgi:hypothetical protein